MEFPTAATKGDVFLKHKILLCIMGVRLPGFVQNKLLVVLIEGMNLLLPVLFGTMVAGFLLGAIRGRDYPMDGRLFAAGVCANAATAFIKQWLMRANQRALADLMDQLNGFQSDTLLGRLSQRLNRTYDGLAIFYHFAMISDVLLNNRVKLPFPFWTPWYENPSFNYFVMWAFQVCIILKTINNLPMDTFVLHLSNQLCHRFLYLRNSLQVVGYSGAERDRLLEKKYILEFAESTADQEALFRRCIQEHHELLRLKAILTNVLNKIFVAQGINAFVSLCVVIYILTRSKDFISDFFRLSTALVATLIQVLISCWSGEYIKIMCEQTNEAIYSTNWMDMPPELKSSVHIAQIYTSKEVILKGAFVFDLSLATYETFVKQVFSFVTVMYQFL